MKKTLAIAPAVLLILLAVTPAFAEAGLLKGTWGTEDFVQQEGVVLANGEVGVRIIIEIDTNLGSVTHTIETPFSTWVFRGNGGFTFQGAGTWDFGNGDVIHTQLTGVHSFGSGQTPTQEAVIGGEGAFVGAAGTIHVTGFPDDEASQSGFVAGVISLN